MTETRGELTTVDGLVQLSFLVQGALQRRADEHELSVIQMRLLGVLRDRTPTMSELAALLELDKSSVSGLVDRAERRRLVGRVPSDTDRRAVRVILTEAGRRLVTSVSASFEKDIAAILAPLPASSVGDLSRLVSRLLVSYAAAHGVDLLDADQELT